MKRERERESEKWPKRERKRSINESLIGGNLSDGYRRASLKLERERERREKVGHVDRENGRVNVLGSKGRRIFVDQTVKGTH